MNPKSQPHSDPTQASPEKPEASYKVCRSCMAKQVLSAYSPNKYGKDGFYEVCKECRSQGFRIYRKTKYDAKSTSDKDDTIIRSIQSQNSSLIAIGLANLSVASTFTCIGFEPYTNRRYKVHFGKSRYDMPSMALFSTDGNFYKEVVFSVTGEKLKIVPKQILGFLKLEGIRLELSDSYVDYMIKTVYI